LKGSGYFGILKNSNGQDVTEFSIGVEVNGKEIEIPTLVPTLNEDEIQNVLDASAGKAALSQEVIKKAQEFSMQRIRNGLSPFKVSGDLN
jgi:hypothetical protein